MIEIPNSPNYPFDPIWSVEALARGIGVQLVELLAVAAIANRSYRPVKLEPGSTREVFSAKPRLKAIQRRIKDSILRRVDFPEYLTGSVRGRDYITNAKLHERAHILICEDVTKFFPSVTAAKVRDIWRHFFKFSDEVADLLTRLTTKDAALPQGASTSSYLANLVLWRDEPHLQAKLAAHGIKYSRYVDDMSMSSKLYLAPGEQQQIIADVYGMLRRNGLSAKRKKHEIYCSSQRMIVTKVIVNAKPSMGRMRRSAIRTQVHKLEQLVATGDCNVDLSKFADATSNVVGQMGRFHVRDANLLRPRVRKARQTIREKAPTFTTVSKSHSFSQPADTSSIPPWESSVDSST